MADETHPDEQALDAQALKARITEILDRNAVMAVATVRPDGWPQATMVGYAHDGLTLYFVVARRSQKFANIQRDPRVSIAIGRLGPGELCPDRILGLSMAAQVSEVTDPDEIERLNALAARTRPQQAVFAPREVSAAVLRAMPTVVSIVDLSVGAGQPDLVYVTREEAVRRAPPDAEG